MSKRKLVIVLAIWIALMPFLGFPGSWENFFVVISGLLIVLLTVDFRFLRRKRMRPRRPKNGMRGPSDTYVENAPMARVEEFKGELTK